MRILEDEQLRYLAAKILNLASKRTLQVKVGASDLSNPCDRDVAYALAGIKRRNPNAERTWLGAEIGTGIHAHAEERLTTAHGETVTPEEKQLFAEVLGLTPNAAAERHIIFGHIVGYGDVGGTIDLDLDGQIADWKGTTWPKMATLLDFVAEMRGETHRYWAFKKAAGRRGDGYELKCPGDATAWRTAAKHADELGKMKYKMDGYFGQQSLYMLGRELEGRPVTRGSIIWVNRDGNGYFDVPDQPGWDDPKRRHDINILTFPYNRDYADALMARAQRIFNELQAGKAPSDFPSQDLCWACSHQQERAEQRAVDLSAEGAEIILDMKEAA